MTIVALVVLALLVPITVFDLARRPTIRRLALRNLARRPGEAALVVGGSLLATALITASFLIADSFGTSVRALASDFWGPTDELVVTDLEAVPQVMDAVEALPPDLVDGAMAVAFTRVAVAGSDEGGRVEPEVRLVEAEPAQVVTFTGSNAALGSIDPADLGPTELVLNQEVADNLAVTVGDQVEIHLNRSPVAFTVAAVAPDTGLNGFAQIITTPGAVSGHFDQPDSVVTAGALVSNQGDDLSGARHTDAVVAALEDQLGAAATVDPVKQEVLDDADDEAAEMQELFGTVGGFSVAAGILLVVNLFVMLAGERQSEMGILRATGLRRGHLVRAFALEGLVYGVAAAAIGVGVGIGVAAVVVAMADGLFGSSVTIRLDVAPTSLLSGAVIGLMVSQLTVVLTSWRITRLNIVRAIRDLPEPPSRARSRRRLVLGGLGLVAAVALLTVAGDTPLVSIAAPPLALVSLVPLVGRYLPARAVLVVACGLALAWVAAVFGLRPEVMDNPDISLFLVQGVLLVGLATVMATTVGPSATRALQGLTRAGIGTRLGLAQPLARPARTGLLVAMYALVIFTLTFMLVMNAVFQAQVPEFARQAGGRYHLYLDANATSGLTADDLAAEPGVAGVAPVIRGVASGRVDASQPRLGSWRVSGIDEAFLSADPPPLVERMPSFADDAQVWAAIVGEEANTAAGGPWVIVDADTGLNPGDVYHFQGTDGSFRAFTVAANTDQGWIVRAGALVGRSEAELLLGEGRPPTRFYLTITDGTDPAALAADLTTGGADQGIEAQTFEAAARAETNQQEGFLNLLQAYLGLGLLIGIAGLGVVLVRAVRERSRQFGVMRALGVAAPVIRRSFLVEAGVVGFQGVVLGIGMGLLSSWQVLTRSTAFEEGLSFTVPVVLLAGLGVLCLTAALATAAIPAVRAGRTVPAAALRMAG